MTRRSFISDILVISTAPLILTLSGFRWKNRNANDYLVVQEWDIFGDLPPGLSMEVTFLEQAKTPLRRLIRPSITAPWQKF